MTNKFGRYALELFPFDNAQLKNVSKELELRKYSLYFPSETKDLFTDDINGAWHLVQLLRAKNIVATVAEENSLPYLVTLGKCPYSKLKPYFMKDKKFEVSLNDEGHLTSILLMIHILRFFGELFSRN